MAGAIAGGRIQTKQIALPRFHRFFRHFLPERPRKLCNAFATIGLVEQIGTGAKPLSLAQFFIEGFFAIAQPRRHHNF